MECPVCFCVYNTLSNTAMKLSCAHTICRSCMNSLQKEDLVNCPLCFRKTLNIKDISKCQTIENMILAKENSSNLEIEENKINVTFAIRNLKGQVLEYTMKKSETILELKQNIELSEKLPVNAQWLLLNGRALNNSMTIEQSGIQGYEVIYLVVRSFGGFRSCCCNHK